MPPELKGRAPYRPMVRDQSCTTGKDWDTAANSNQPIIHFFNEPERAGISAESAANTWDKQMVSLRKNKGKKLVSPSCASDEKGKAWIEDFMHRVKDNMPDYLGLHYYGTDVSAAQKFITDMHNKWPHLHVIVSEIASISRDGKAVVQFTKEMANWMDKEDWVFEYGFFGCMPHRADDFVSQEAQLMNPDGTFTPLMKMLQNDQPM